jgi:putative ABC transport system ATP-binding protein
MSNDILLSTHGLHKTYGKRDAKFEALRGINLEIHRGESVAIIGKSGSGKSTLMHLLALLDRPTKGEIRLDGQPTSKLKQRRLNHLRNKEFGFVFQSFFMNANDSVLNNVILPLKIAGVGRRERKSRAMEALRIVGLESKAKNKANDLSGGQKQRVCIARAIVNDPKVIFADEPTGNLDSTTGAKIEDILFRLNREQGITLIIVTHDQELANKCERQIHISDGHVVSDDTITADIASAEEAEEEAEPTEEEVAQEIRDSFIEDGEDVDINGDGIVDENGQPHITRIKSKGSK